MPYKRSLQSFTLPEFYAQAPESWEKRLREVSPVLPDLDHLRFRKFNPTNPDGSDRGWLHNERPQWMLYSCRPIRLVAKERAGQFDRHWSELPEQEQPGRKAMVSDYQHFMWQSQGLYVKPFLILQGEWGGTPAKYTEKEIAFLESSDCLSEPFPIGFFPACPFDERVVTQIAHRDRLLKMAGDYNELARMDSADAMRAEDEEATLVRRQTYLDTYSVMIQPAKEFMGHWLQRSENRESLPAAPTGLADTLSQWRDHFLQTGQVMGGRPAIQKKIQVTVN